MQGYYTIDSRHLISSQHSRKSLADKKLLLGVKQFNLDPKKGLEFLEKAGKNYSSEPEDLETRLVELRNMLVSRNYNKNIVKAAITKAKLIPRIEALKRVTKKENKPAFL